MALHTHTPARLVGCNVFKRTNPRSDAFDTLDFHHLEIIAPDAASVSGHWANALGLERIATSDRTTGNRAYVSHVLRSGSLVVAISAPYDTAAAPPADDAAAVANDAASAPNQLFTSENMRRFLGEHGLSACAVGLRVADAAAAFEASVARGAEPRTEPRTHSGCTVAEIRLYGDVALRFVSGDALDDGSLAFLPGYVAARGEAAGTYGIERVDHVVGNVPELLPAVDYLQRACGFHEFAEFTAEDVGTVDSGLNSMVLATNNERVLLPINEPTYGSKRKSQILTYIEQHHGPGVQHIALKTGDIFATVRAMRQARGGFSFMERPSEAYYAKLPARLGADLTAEQVAQCQDLGILADKDNQGVLLQIFTKPVGDRSTLFFEIIQRVGCMVDDSGEELEEQLAGCGGFGKGNFSELFKAIERYETKAGLNDVGA